MKDLIQKKLDQYAPKTSDDEENALKEISQEVALHALSKSNFFKAAAFQGGTCLRIVHGLDRFSEDLDFALLEPNQNFHLDSYLDAMKIHMNTYGFDIEVSGSDQADRNVKSRFVKDESLKKLLNFSHHTDLRKKLKIKVEVDTNPPAGAKTVSGFLDFPTDFSIRSHDLTSLFAGKCHALLCRSYIKGRDWYDFSWYVAGRHQVNYTLLSNALNQTGPWQDRKIQVDDAWLKRELLQRVQQITWADARRDVSRFISPDKSESINLWSIEFFTAKVAKMFSR